MPPGSSALPRRAEREHCPSLPYTKARQSALYARLGIRSYRAAQFNRPSRRWAVHIPASLWASRCGTLGRCSTLGCFLLLFLLGFLRCFLCQFGCGFSLSCACRRRCWISRKDRRGKHQGAEQQQYFFHGISSLVVIRKFRVAPGTDVAWLHWLAYCLFPGSRNGT